MELEEGKIVQVSNDKIVVEMEAGAQCTSCGSKHACNVFSGDTVRRIEIPILQDRHDLNVGDQVSLKFKSQTRILSAFLVFILPLFFLIAGYFVGMKILGSEGRAILFAFSGLILSFILIRFFNIVFAKKDSFSPTISKIKTEEKVVT